MAEYYVSPTGNDSKGTGTLAKPWKTITKGVASMNAGDLLYLRGGTYVEIVKINKDNVTLKNYQNEKPIIDGQKQIPQPQDTYEPLIHVRGERVTIDGLEMRNSLGRGIEIRGNHSIVRKCTVNWTRRQAVMLYGDDSLIEHCSIIGASRIGVGGSFEVLCERSIVRYNTVSDGLGEGLLIYRSKQIQVIGNVVYNIKKVQIYIDGVETLLLEGNIAFATDDTYSNVGPGEGIKITNEIYADFNVVTRNITAINNLVINCSRCFHIAMGWDDHSGTGEYVHVPFAGFKDIKVANNTFVNGKKQCARIWEQIPLDPNQHTPCWFVNNVMIQENDGPILEYRSKSSLAKFTFANNLYSKSPGEFILGKESNEVVTDSPVLVNPSKPLNSVSDFDINNYKLLKDSPVINKGTSNYVDVAKDFFGTVRPAGSAPDIGMQEYATETISAAFSAQPTEGTSPLVVSFKDKSQSSSPITPRFWDFGDGGVSTEKDPVHTYQAGNFTVSLRVVSAAGKDIATKKDLISVKAAPSSFPDRVSDGLGALYRFDEGTGNTIFDVSAVGSPLDLKISDNSAVKWLTQGLEITNPAVIVSSGPASKIIYPCRESNAITIETWIKPRNLDQDGPARIVSLSKNAYSRNITLGQGLWGTLPSDLYDLRLRTTERSANGLPSFSSPSGTVQIQKSHLVITRDSTGRLRIFLDNVIVAETFVPGDFSTWNPRFPLLLANEASGYYPWLGNIHLLAVYERALTPDEVKQNFDAGTELTPRFREQGFVSTDWFRRFVLVNDGNGLNAGKGTAVAYGVQYPDMRCVLCANGQLNSIAIYPDISAITRAYRNQKLKVHWLD